MHLVPVLHVQVEHKSRFVTSAKEALVFMVVFVNASWKVYILENMKTYFQHPVNATKRTHLLLDVCHMVRNTLGEGEVIVNKNGIWICWKYIVELEPLQSKETRR